MKIATEFVYPPIPNRDFDWQAIDADTFDAEYIDGVAHTSCPVGHGRTEAEAIADLLEKIEDRLPEPPAAPHGKQNGD